MKYRSLLIIASLASITACGGANTTSTTTATTATKVGAVYFGDTAGNSWTLQHDKTLSSIASASVVISKSDNIVDDSNAELALEQMAAAGNKVIFATWPGYSTAILKVAPKYPKVCFQLAGNPRITLAKEGTQFPTEESLPANIGTYNAAIAEGRYLSGMAAGAATKAGKIGFVASFPTADSISGINAFTLGVRAINSDAVVQVTWTATKLDEQLERQAAESLIRAGADVIAQSTVSVGPGIAAEANGVKWVGNNTDQHSIAPKGWLTAPVWNWNQYYANTVAAVQKGSCPKADYFGNVYNKTVTLAPFGSSVDKTVQGEITVKFNEIRSHAFTPFTGPVMAQDGSTMVPSGTEVEANNLQTMTAFVQGVLGSAQG